MFTCQYAILAGPGYYNPSVEGRVLLAVDDKLDSEETYTLNIVGEGLITERGALLISGQVDGIGLPATEFLLPDIPNDIMEDIKANGVSIVDAKNDLRMEFTVAEVENLA